jgi:hypothetical protein
MHSSRCTRRMQERGKLSLKISGTARNSASSAENNFQSYNYKILPTPICERSEQINLPTAHCLMEWNLPTENWILEIGQKKRVALATLFNIMLVKD